MNFFDLVNISERYMEPVNPSTPEKVLTVGKVPGLKEGSRVIEFGCGYGEVLALWAKQFGACGTGVDIREHACNRARQKMSKLGLTDRTKIICVNAAEHSFEKQVFYPEV